MNPIIKQIHKTLDYLIEENRRKTFKKWIFSDKDACNADKMAEAGFIFTGNKVDVDDAKCFFCNKSLNGWEPTDDPWQEHLKHAPKCAYARLQKPMENLTVKELLDIKNMLIESIITSYYDTKCQEIENVFEEYEEKILFKLGEKSK